MAYRNDRDAYRHSAQAVLVALEAGVLKGVGKAYSLSDAAQAHTDLESGRSSGALYLKP